MLLQVTYFVFQLAGYPNERSKWWIITLGIIYAVAAGYLSARHRVIDWLLALSLSLFYLLGLSLGLYHLLRHNQTYGGLFWSNKFYLSPILLFISIPVAVFFGARFGSKPSLLRFAALILVFAIASGAVQYTDVKAHPAKELNYSTDIVAGESSEFAMRLELRFRLQITDDPIRFRTASTPPPANDRGGWHVTVLKKDYTFSPNTNMTVNVDGKDIETSMWPINGPDGSSHIDFSKKQDYSDIVNWSVGPGPDLLGSLVNAHHIMLTWGNVKVVLPDEQVESLRTFVRNWFRILQDEDALCTNPLCKQGALNPQR